MKISISFLGQRLSTETVILCAVAAAAIGYGFRVILSKLFGHMLELSIGFGLAVAGYLFVILLLPEENSEHFHENKRKLKTLAKRFPGYAFTLEENWGPELVALSEGKPLPTPVFPESFLVSDSADQIIDYIIRDFVLSWYRSFTKDTMFPAHVDSAIRYAVSGIGERVSQTDWAEFILGKLVPLFTDHFAKFVAADKAVRDRSLSRHLTESSEFSRAVASEYGNGKGLHEAISLKNYDYELFRKAWLRKTMTRILPQLIPPNEAQSKVVMDLCTDIVACSVLYPVLSMLSESDFWNQIVINQAGSTLQDRKRVERLRKALDAHSNTGNIPTSSVSTILSPTPKKLTGSLKSTLRLSSNADQSAYDKFIRSINRCNSLAELRQTRYYIALQLKRTEQKGGDTRYANRLQTAKKAVELKISELSGSENQSSSGTLEVDPRENYTLAQILNDPACSLLFMEFMEQRHRTVLLQFWLTVNGIRNPLEGDYDEDVAPEIDTVEDDTDMRDRDDIIQIYNSYFTGSLPGISASAASVIAEFAKQENSTHEQYVKARMAILSTQSDIYKQIQKKDLSDFKKSDLFLKYLASNSHSNANISSQSNVDELQMDLGPEDDIDIKPLQDDSIVDAVQEAFDDIMKGSSVITGPRSKTLFGDDSDSTLFRSQSSASHRSSRLFDDSSDEIDFQPEEYSIQDDVSDDNSALHMAAPGDLGLTEAIGSLSSEIEKLYSQETVVDSLLQKAELTNNTGDLRILRKSKASLDRELQRKELQRQQYIVQESDNSLFGKSRIQILSYVSSTDNNGEYKLYLVEVQRFGYDGNVAAGWIVARRYSQFFALHQHLKTLFPQISKLEFPKKGAVVLKFQQKSFFEGRRIALERYLKELLKIPEVCQSKTFRAFLSSETFSVGNDVSGYDSENDDRVSLRASLDLSNSVDLGRIAAASTTEIEAELNQVENGSLKPFLQPVCDLFIEVFGLNRGDNWLRGRAVVVVLQQLLGGTIEKKVRDTIIEIINEQNTLDMIQKVQDSIWPEGLMKPSSVPRTSSEKVKCAHDTKIVLQTLIHDLSSKVVGSSSARYASSKLFGMYQNEILNAHLVYSIVERVIDELFDG